MSVYSHRASSSTATDGRPPYSVAPVRYCECCGLFAMWLLPEMARCHHHLPDELIPLIEQRAQAWEDIARESWEYVVRAMPVEL